MKNPALIASSLMLLGSLALSSCSTSTPASAPSSSLVVPSPIDFGNIRLGLCSDSLLGVPNDTTISIHNSGTDTLHIHSVTVQGSGFTVVSFDSVIPPSGYGPMRLQFCPPASGNTSATLTITSNAAPDSSMLSGNGVPYSPGVSSQYTYTAFNLDTAGRTVGTAFTVTDSIIAVGLTYQGQSNVTEVSDSTYFIPESNGDVNIYAKGFSTYPDTLLFGSGWQTLPFGSQGKNIQLYSDNQTYTNDSLNESITLSIRDSASFVETTNTTIEGFTVQESHVHVVESALYTVTGKGSTLVTVTVEIFFSPNLGTIINQTRVKRAVSTALSGKSTKAMGGGRQVNLVSFKAH